MAAPVLVTGGAGRVGAVGRTVTELLLKQGKAVRAMVRNEDERALASRNMGAEVVVGDLLDLDSMHRVIAGCVSVFPGEQYQVPRSWSEQAYDKLIYYKNTKTVATRKGDCNESR
jgi:nucleoside-diphosphate-sugar epimerase